MEEAFMAIDPAKFRLHNVVDTCSVWNVLSSRKLYDASRQANCEFCMTDFVRYECVAKKRSAAKPVEVELRGRLQKEWDAGRFSAHASTIDDLQQVARLDDRKRLGKGELSSIAFAMKTNQAVMTDDQKARKLATEVGHACVQTTPHLFAWLLFTGKLVDGDKVDVIKQNTEMGQTLRPHFEDAYLMALHAKYQSSAGS